MTSIVRYVFITLVKSPLYKTLSGQSPLYKTLSGQHYFFLYARSGLWWEVEDCVTWLFLVEILVLPWMNCDDAPLSVFEVCQGYKIMYGEVTKVVSGAKNTYA